MCRIPILHEKKKDSIELTEKLINLLPHPGKKLAYYPVGGIKSGFYYTGARTIKELWQKARFIQITTASLTESHPHDILITNPGKNY